MGSAQAVPCVPFVLPDMIQSCTLLIANLTFGLNQGEAAVGKSSVVLRFVSNEFQENKEPTIGAAFLTVSTHVGRLYARRCADS